MSATDGWFWWAGRNEEWLDIGPENTRDDIIAAAINDIGAGEGDFVILEGVMHDLRIHASTVIDDAYEHWGNGSDLFSTERDYPEPCGSKEDRLAAEQELQEVLDSWLAKWRHTFPSPNMFASTRNMETIRNTLDPDTLPGGRDNPRGEQ